MIHNVNVLCALRRRRDASERTWYHFRAHEISRVGLAHVSAVPQLSGLAMGAILQKDWGSRLARQLKIGSRFS